MQVSFEPRPSGHYGQPSAPLRQLMQKEYFRAADTKLTYRQIDLLAYSGLLGEAAKGKWKRFDTKDLIYLQVVSELKRFGLESGQLQGVRELFYAEKNWGTSVDGQRITNAMDYVLFEIFHGIDWVLMLRPNGDVFLRDQVRAASVLGKYVSNINLNLDALIIRVALQTKGEDGETEGTKPLLLLIEGLLRDEKFDELGREFLFILKDSKYREITIVKKDGDEVVIEAKNRKETTSSDVLHAISSIEAHDFQKIEVTTRKKKPVCYAYTDIFKGKYLKNLKSSG